MSAGGETREDALARLLAIMDALRDPEGGCPWDLAQDFRSIAPHTLEEVYEVVDAIETGDWPHLRDELGDLLFQVVFYARLGKEEGLFDFSDIAQGIGDKLLNRHPHVFPDGTLASAGRKPELSAGQVSANWEQIKAAERSERQTSGPASMMDDVPLALGALLRAAKLQKRAAQDGFDWAEASQVLEKVREETEELESALAQADQQAAAEEFGDLLFSMVNLGRHLELNAETCLREASRKFERRYRAMEGLAARQGRLLGEMSPGELDSLWKRVKHEEDDSSVA